MVVSAALLLSSSPPSVHVDVHTSIQSQYPHIMQSAYIRTKRHSRILFSNLCSTRVLTWELGQGEHNVTMIVTCTLFDVNRGLPVQTEMDKQVHTSAVTAYRYDYITCVIIKCIGPQKDHVPSSETTRNRLYTLYQVISTPACQTFLYPWWNVPIVYCTLYHTDL